MGVAAVVGPGNRDLSTHVHSVCSRMEVPYIRTGIVEPRSSGGQTKQLQQQPEVFLYAINVHPSASQLSRAYLSIVRFYRWTMLCIVFGSNHDLVLIQDVIRNVDGIGGKELDIVLRQATAENMKELLKELKAKEINNILVFLNAGLTAAMLKAALQVGIIDQKHHFILTHLDADTMEMDDYSHNDVKLTALRLIDREHPKTAELLRQMKQYQTYTGTRILHSTEPPMIKTEAALTYDAVRLLGMALDRMESQWNVRTVNLSCDTDSNDAWFFGSTLYGYLSSVDTEGMSGHISFDRGIRQHFSLDILHLHPRGFRKVGEWSTVGGLNMSRTGEPSRGKAIFANKTLLVTSINEAPYIMESVQTGKTSQDFEGFCVDMLNEIAEKVGFQYAIELVPDGKYGAPDKEGNWNGMVRQLMDKKADLAVASLTINYLREQVIDFTKPFMNLGISILFKRPRRESPGLFSFLNPLAPEIWMYVIIAYFSVSTLLYILARFSPYEWHNLRPCDPGNAILENVFSLSNSFWFVVGTLMQQGSDINPRAVSTRIVGGMWWFFTLIIISSYTANLAAFLTVERMITPIENAEDLAKQTTILYGTIAGGSTMTFFRESKIPTYQAMWSFMESTHDRSLQKDEIGVFMKTTQEGIDKVVRGDYAFLMESTMIDYNIQRNCELMQVGGLLDSKGYGIGTQIKSPYRDPITMAILELQENGRLQMLYNKWWKNAGACGSDEKMKEKKAHSLGVANVGGIFVVLLFGLAMAITMGLVEFIWHHFSHLTDYDRSKKQSIWAEILSELRFAIRIRGSSKRLRSSSHCSRCSYHHPSSSTVAQEDPATLCLSKMTTDIKAAAVSSVSSCLAAGLDVRDPHESSPNNIDDAVFSDL